MTYRLRIFVELLLAMGFLVPAAWAQKPSAPAPPPSAPPSSPSTGRAPTTDLSGTQPVQPQDDLVMFLRGRVMTDDGTPVPKELLIERVCNASVRQQVYATPSGDFSMQLGAIADSYLDASGERDGSDYRLSQATGSNRVFGQGISRRDLANCELRASVSGFHSSIVSLVDLDVVSSNADVGAIVVQRATKIKGMTLSATPYKAPPGARKAYEKGLEAAKNNKLADARQYLEKAVAIYPKFTNAWFMLGTVLQKQNQNSAARTAYTQATTTDAKFLPPYLSLALMAYNAENWTEVVTFTHHIIDLDPLNYSLIAGDILDLDPVNYADAYFYNSLANFKLNKIEEAEKSGRKAERLELRTRFPQVHLLLAEICARKNNYAGAITEIQTYLELVPSDKNADQIRERLAELEKLNGAAPTSEKPD